MVTNHLYMYRHRTASILPPKPYVSIAPGRRQEQSYDKKLILDIVWCPVKFKYYLGRLYGVFLVFGGKVTSAGHHTVPGRRPVGVTTHRTGTGRFCLKFKSSDLKGDHPCRHLTVPGRASYDV